MGTTQKPDWNGKSVEELIGEANRALQESRELSEQERIEYDAEYGYPSDETPQDSNAKEAIL